jgi:hypothetical protein
MTKSPIEIKDSNCNDSNVVTTQELKNIFSNEGTKRTKKYKRIIWFKQRVRSFLCAFAALCETGLSS